MSLLVLFEQSDSEINISNVSDLNIKDSKNNLDVPVLGIKIDEQYLQGVYLQQPKLTFNEIENGTTVVIEGYSNLILCCTFLNDNDTADIKTAMEDNNGIRFVGDSITLSAEDETDASGNYLSKYALIKTFGASKIKITVASGNPQKIYVSGV